MYFAVDKFIGYSTSKYLPDIYTSTAYKNTNEIRHPYLVWGLYTYWKKSCLLSERAVNERHGWNQMSRRRRHASRSICTGLYRVGAGQGTFSNHF